MTEIKTEEIFAQIAADETENMYLNFNVENEVYGIEIRHVLQIIGMQEITKMPDMPPGMKGFINLRGSIIPVVSMRFRFGKAEEIFTDRTCIIVTQVGEREIGLIVDAIQEATTIYPEDIKSTPSVNGSMDKSYISGVATLPSGRLCLIVDVQRLLEGQI